jgi:cholesterol transport system auxiliary component
MIHRYTLDHPAAEKVIDPNGPVILVSRIHTRAGLASQRMMYRRSAHGVAYFTRSQWVAPPAEMLGPLVVDSLEASGRFNAVVQPGTPVAAELRLDLELAELYQDFSSQPGTAHLSLRAQLLDMNRRLVLATQQFDYAVSFEPGNAASGVEALNALLEGFLPELDLWVCISSGV